MRRLYRTSTGRDDVHAWCTSRLAAWAVPHEVAEVSTTLGHTHVVATGGGDRGCVFVPGTNFSAATSTRLLEGLAERMRVYAADLPGQPGLSAEDRPSDERLGYSQWVTDLLCWGRGQHPASHVLGAGLSGGRSGALFAPPDLGDGAVALSPAGIIPVRPSRE